MVPTMGKAFIFGGEMEVYSGVVQLVYQFQWLHADDDLFRISRCENLKHCFDQNTLVRENGTFVPRRQAARRQRQRRQKRRRGQIGDITRGQSMRGRCAYLDFLSTYQDPAVI